MMIPMREARLRKMSMDMVAMMFPDNCSNILSGKVAAPRLFKTQRKSDMVSEIMRELMEGTNDGVK